MTSTTLYGSISFAVFLGVAAAAQQQRPSQQKPADENVPAVTITATEYRFSPSEIHAVAGRPLRVTLVNNGKQAHGLRFNLSDRVYPFPSNVPPGDSVTAVIDSVGDAGHFQFYCPVDAHQGQGMTGTLIVDPK